MIHCPHLTPNNICEVASGMAGCPAKVTPAACNACQNESNPRAINVVTIGMALVNKKRRKQDTRELHAMLRSYLPDRQPESTTLKIADYRPGPGNELKKMLAWFARPSESCNCPVNIEHGPRRHDERLGRHERREARGVRPEESTQACRLTPQACSHPHHRQVTRHHCHSTVPEKVPRWRTRARRHWKFEG